MYVLPLYDDDYWFASIDWKAPRKWYHKTKEYAAGVDLDKKYKSKEGIYRFERLSNRLSNRRELFYVGIAFEDTFDERLHQGYHEALLRNYRKTGDFWVSVGIIDLPGALHTRERYEQIEAILIYFLQPRLNTKKKKWIRSDPFTIDKTSYRGLIPRYIRYPVAEIR